MSRISTHVLDLATGRPAQGVAVHLFADHVRLNSTVTDENGRCSSLLPPESQLRSGTYRIVFDVLASFPDSFYPEITLAFTVKDPASHHHVPLLLSPFGYTTYRGS